jgi:flagellar biosynthetic protein FliR
VIEASILVFALVLVRVATLLAVFPLFGGRNLPNTVKIGFAVAMSVCWSTLGPAAEAAAGSPPVCNGHWLWYGAAVVREVIVGGSLGVTLGLFLLPAQIAGSYLAQELGLTLATLTNPGDNSAATVGSQLMSCLGTLLFFALDLHHAVLRALYASLLSRPVGTEFQLPAPERVLAGFNDAHESGLLIAAPAGVTLFLLAVVMLVIMRVAPKFNLFSFGLSFRLALGFLAVLLFLPEMCQLLSRMFLRMGQCLTV